MDIASLLSPSAVKVVGSVSSKKRLMQDLGEIAGACYGLDPLRATEALQEREGLGPTGVGHGIALPHARLTDTTKLVGVFLRIEKALDFDSVDRQPVDLVFALFAPKEAGVEHLKALALVSRTMRDSDICAKLRANIEPATLHAVLTERLTSQAA